MHTKLSAFSIATTIAIGTQVGAVDHTVIVNADGTYDPVWLNIGDGDTVTWEFPDRRRAIVRVHPDGTSFPNWCEAYVPYDPNDPNEFSGPMPLASAGLFALGPKANGLEIYPAGDTTAPCWNPTPGAMDAVTASTGRFVCNTGDPNAPLQELLDSDALTGVFLRFNWKDIETAPGLYDWNDLDAQVDRVVKAGKQYSIAFKAGQEGHPAWLSTDIGLAIYTFKDAGGGASGCGTNMDLTSPADALYADRYSMFLQAVADHLMENPAWYRALAYIKPSGANLKSHENRLPKSCDAACPICNSEVWAGAGYTPQGIYDFYTQQFQDISAAFPNKSMSYQLIQAGFPRVLNATEYLGCPTAGCENNIPRGTEQTEEILTIGRTNHGLDFVVQHNGLQKDPPASCFSTGMHPVSGTLSDFKGPNYPDGCPNPWVLVEASNGQITGWQTNNLTKISTSEDLDGALENAKINSDGIFVEAYEEVLWKIIEDGNNVLDPTAATPRTLLEWAQVFIQRRRDSHFLNMGLPENLPKTHSHTFTRTIGPVGAEIYHYVDPARCGDSAYNYGVVRILP